MQTKNLVTERDVIRQGVYKNYLGKVNKIYATQDADGVLFYGIMDVERLWHHSGCSFQCPQKLADFINSCGKDWFAYFNGWVAEDPYHKWGLISDNRIKR